MSITNKNESRRKGGGRARGQEEGWKSADVYQYTVHWLLLFFPAKICSFLSLMCFPCFIRGLVPMQFEPFWEDINVDSLITMWPPRPEGFCCNFGMKVHYMGKTIILNKHSITLYTFYTLVLQAYINNYCKHFAANMCK